ncbi:MAG: GHMP kinase [Flavobacteriaceae bacterium]|nr:GHMP kinase [Flavobacteriaceae bacterium]
MNRFYSNGKLLLTGEYFVLDGAKSLALPSLFGQELEVTPIDEPLLIWQSFDVDKSQWLEVIFELPKLRITSTSFISNDEKNTESFAERLQNILLSVRKLNSDFLATSQGFMVKNHLSFDRNWGLGTSSTLINNLAQWTNVCPYELLQLTFGGSGYDIACAKHHSPIFYSVKNGKTTVEEINFQPPFYKNLFFVYLNKKQNSREGIRLYKEQKINDKTIDKITEITEQIAVCSSLTDFEKFLTEHEKIVSKTIHLPTVQEKLFSDYFGITKSLGAWGGDFILATGNENTPNYFRKKGFSTVIPYDKMILQCEK